MRIFLAVHGRQHPQTTRRKADLGDSSPFSWGGATSHLVELDDKVYVCLLNRDADDLNSSDIMLSKWTAGVEMNELLASGAVEEL